MNCHHVSAQIAINLPQKRWPWIGSWDNLQDFTLKIFGEIHDFREIFSKQTPQGSLQMATGSSGFFHR